MISWENLFIFISMELMNVLCIFLFLLPCSTRKHFSNKSLQSPFYTWLGLLYTPYIIIPPLDLFHVNIKTLAFYSCGKGTQMQLYWIHYWQLCPHKWTASSQVDWNMVSKKFSIVAFVSTIIQYHTYLFMYGISQDYQSFSLSICLNNLSGISYDTVYLYFFCHITYFI